MKHISNIINIAQIKEARMIDNKEVVNEDTAKVVNLLFKELRAIFPAFKQAWPNQEAYNCAKKNWVAAFMSVNIHTSEQLRHGLQKCRLSTNPFAPSVGQFIQWCSPEPTDLGLPNVDEAYALSILMNRQFSDYKPTCPKTFSVIRNVIDKIGSHAYRSMPSEASYNTFKRFYSNSYIQVANDGFKGLRELPKSSDESEVQDAVDGAVVNARLEAMRIIRNAGLPVRRQEWDEAEDEQTS